MWVILAIGSAFFAGVSSILAKCGIRKTPSEVATAIRTAIVIVMSVIMTLIVGSLNDIGNIDKLEGFNNKIKVAKRNAYGFRNLDFFFAYIRFLSIPRSSPIHQYL